MEGTAFKNRGRSFRAYTDNDEDTSIKHNNAEDQVLISKVDIVIDEGRASVSTTSSAKTYENDEGTNSYGSMSSDASNHSIQTMKEEYNEDVHATNASNKTPNTTLFFTKSISVVSFLFLLGYFAATTENSSFFQNNTRFFQKAKTTESEPSSSIKMTTDQLVIPPLYITKGVASDPPLTMSYPADPLPFSYLGPSDLGLDVHYRSDDSRPGEVFGAWRRSNEEEEKLRRDHPNKRDRKLRTAFKRGEEIREKRAMPTNMWYENLLLGSINYNHVSDHNRAYTIPYIIDFVGPVPGIRVQFPHVVASDTIVQMATVPRHGLTLGTVSYNDNGEKVVDSAYVIDEEYPPSQLALGLKWSKKGGLGFENDGNNDENGEGGRCPTMRTSVLRGIPYVTMKYSRGMKAVISAEVPLVGSPLIDNGNNPTELQCGILYKNGTTSAAPANKTATISTTARVEGEVALTFEESDFTWLIFFSRPVQVECFREVKDKNAKPLPPGVVDLSVRSSFELHVVDDSSPLIVRAALANNCTSGLNPLYCVGGKPRRQTHLGDLLRTHADIYPGYPETRYEFPSNSMQGEEASYALIHFDWKPRSMKEDTIMSKERYEITTSQVPDRVLEKEMLAYALPHHTDSIQQVVGSTNSKTGYCSEGLHGQACLLRGGEWVMKENLDGPPSFVAPRPPHHSIIPSLADAISTDIHFSLPDYYMAGVGDTYFSGKMLAKLGRIIVITSELKGLAATPDSDSFNLDDPSERELKRIVEAAKNADLPSDEVMMEAVARLRSGVEVWMNGTAEAKFIYDDDWGGLVNCGCLFNGETQHCDNDYSHCPAFSDPGLNFGNGFYNDHHFHYGYMIYAAAVVANYDLSWGRRYNQQVLALIRDIANPSIHDKYFPAFRHKDWFLGSSWASGIATIGGQPYLNGRNQESSSEAIHAYEAIGLYGAVMVHAWGDGVSSDVSENDNAITASRVRDMGRLLTATEIRSAQRYWHVLHGDLAINTIYPKVYRPAVVGMMWDTMCQFQTWFGSAPYLAYGIQLMPLTSVSERRDSLKWVQQMYPPFAESCNSDKNCEEQGWSVLQYAMLATIGHRDLAAEKANKLPPSVFESAGGNGHSLTNTLWYIATRAAVAEPLLLDESSSDENVQEENLYPQSLVCECPETCTENQLGVDAGGYTCESRIRWLMTAFGKTEVGACRQVGGTEFPDLCGGCDPDRCANPPPLTPASPQQIEMNKECPPCPPAVCKSEINRCPRSLLAPFLCLSGANRGGCAQTPWMVAQGGSGFCTECCRLTDECFGE